MSTPPPPSAAPPSAQMVANAFVHQYYHILHQSPQFVFRFYQEGSKLGRPDPLGAMASVTTMQAINDKILSMDYNEFRAEIKTVDAQESLEGGVTVLVTGYLTGKDNVPRNFTQSFFLATQDKGYYVLNDMFRYVEVPAAASSPEQETTPPAQAQHNKELSVMLEAEEGEEEEVEEDDEEIDEELYNPSEDEEELVKEVVEVHVEEVINEALESSPPVATDSSSPAAAADAAVQEDAPKKSYASIVKVKKESASPLPAPPLLPARTTPPVNTQRQAAPAPTLAPAPETPAANSNSTETSSVQEGEADGHSIYIKNLPLTATPTQLEDEFKKFGPIKTNGIQVRSHKQGFCFGFVEFEAANAVQSAIEASPIIIGGRQAYVEEKRPAGSRVSNRGRFLPGRGGFWNDGGRGRAGYGGRGNERVEYNNRSDFGGRGSVRGGTPNRGADGIYQRVDSTGSTGGRGNRPGSVATNAPRNYTPRVPAPALEMN